ncbi:hypothetical protein [Paenibacillus amylolyticus]|uniref:Uncharacterized protein n=1 Tax=Paenibacillus amylolyticus TaxID=1451 RepID=A0A124DX95_PAEAM|nr:hypothetical protein [Paenibacillus amylolyticus]GAS80373.1 unknown protein [Paenibacillus amylolyticus]
MKENFKEYKLETRDDFIIYLRYLIQLGQRQLYYFKLYLKEMELDIERLRNNGIIDGLTYEKHRTSIAFLTIYLFNLIGDESKGALSYRKFRKLAEKKEIGLIPLNDKIKNILVEANNARNWSCHIPESYLHAEFEAAKKHNKNFSKEGVIRIPSPIIVTIHKTHSIEWLMHLVNDSKNNRDNFVNVLLQMKKDFSILIGYRMEVLTEYSTDLNTLDYHVDIPGFSIQMQNK